RLNREEQAFHVDVEVIVKKRFRDLTERLESRNTGIGEEHINAPIFLTDGRRELRNIGEFARIRRQHQRVRSELFLRGANAVRIAPCRNHLRAFLHKQLRRRESDSRRSASDQCDFPVQFSHTIEMMTCRIAPSTNTVDCREVRSSLKRAGPGPALLTFSCLPQTVNRRKERTGLTTSKEACSALSRIS